MSHLSFSHSFPVTDIEPDFGSEKARVSPTEEGGVGGGHRANCRGRRHRTTTHRLTRRLTNPNPAPIHRPPAQY